MLAILIIILVLLWAAVVWSIYWNFIVFYSNFSETENYHRAYYASISALERAKLVTKQRHPWYEWSWGFILGSWSGIYNNWWSDKSLSWFSYFGDKKDEISVFRTINSLTLRIPAEWDWDVEWMLSTWDSSNYNMMDYEKAEVFLLYKDNSENNPYDKGKTKGIVVNNLTWEIRLPGLLKGNDFWELDIKKSLVWQIGNLPTNEAIVDRQIRWEYDKTPFTIFSTQALDFQGGVKPAIKEEYDTVFRESDINEGLNFSFWNNWNPFGKNNRWKDASPTIISQSWDDIVELYNFKNVFGIWSGITLRFSLLNLLQWSGHIYPFLEYYIGFWDNKVPDKYFKINAEWTYKDFDVNMLVLEPTVKETVYWNFTSIF